MKTTEELLQPAAILERVGRTVPDKNLHSALVIAKMKPGEDRGLAIHCGTHNTAMGEVLLASTCKGICYAGFTDNNSDIAILDLHRRFPHAKFGRSTDAYQQEALRWFNEPWEKDLPLHLHVRGTAFQWSVWEKLLRIPMGGLTTYAELGGGANMARAAGTAVGDNPVCFLIPCHRAVRSNGRFEDYFWGPARKKALLTMEAFPQEAGF